jgi:hypothetical protein
MLLHPKPLATTDKVGTESQKIIDPDFSRGGSMVGIVLHIQTNQSLGHAVDNGKSKRRLLYPLVLKVKEKDDATNRSKEISWRSKLAATSNNSKDLLFHFPFKFGIKFVSLVETGVRNSNSQHDAVSQKLLLTTTAGTYSDW